MSVSISGHYLDADLQIIKVAEMEGDMGKEMVLKIWEGENGISLVAQLQDLGC